MKHLPKTRVTVKSLQENQEKKKKKNIVLGDYLHCPGKKPGIEISFSRILPFDSAPTLLHQKLIADGAFMVCEYQILKN